MEENWKVYIRSQYFHYIYGIELLAPEAHGSNHFQSSVELKSLIAVFSFSLVVIDDFGFWLFSGSLICHFEIHVYTQTM
jgi:hypothetical protein